MIDRFFLTTYSDQMLCLCQTDFNNNEYFFFRFGLANAIYNHLRLKIRVVYLGNF